MSFKNQWQEISNFWRNVRLCFMGFQFIYASFFVFGNVSMCLCLCDSVYVRDYVCFCDCVVICKSNISDYKAVFQDEIGNLNNIAIVHV